MKPADPRPLVLLTEGDALVGLDLSDAVEQAGYRVLGPLDTTRAALALVEQERPDLAVLDVVLKDGFSSELVREFRQCGVPFLIHTEYQQDGSLANEVRAEPRLQKPACSWDVVATLDELSRARSPLR
ncbi:hypothetical protein [Methylobacterium nigriterrae]|uniref:hypothetical protein n=1 Tax=Methylobacterium nigriterrae TaxID=3127512 RepID=UPI00301351A0